MASLYYVWGQDGAFGVVYVVDPLVVDLGVPKFVDAFYIIDAFLVDLLLIKESGSCVVGELT